MSASLLINHLSILYRCEYLKRISLCWRYEWALYMLNSHQAVCYPLRYLIESCMAFLYLDAAKANERYVPLAQITCIWQSSWVKSYSWLRPSSWFNWKSEEGSSDHPCSQRMTESQRSIACCGGVVMPKVVAGPRSSSVKSSAEVLHLVPGSAIMMG